MQVFYHCLKSRVRVLQCMRPSDQHEIQLKNPASFSKNWQDPVFNIIAALHMRKPLQLT